ncbi:ER degradation-enhancing alpha-mannosidase-like protein-like protein [Emericellopsis cladophorae]|uniref:alpha-1,2-Mannosidase n=1 Tax=Emericellopsis cladophorae TaxID=2686198 RepID=A0A9P9Y508_9HYPO|nr:ER degradation-enhancing alpha-mannosidase-like protein-like protein [Emericellopsis cladophorae]KAI6783348.1 ER degradation-enhancing alpha-mannosidase-like protein-like protein [Emericellopsis cladophorae]
MFRLALLAVCALPIWKASAMRADRLAELRQATVDVFYHGWRNYMDKAFPEDELRPLSCTPLSRDNDPSQFGLNDPLGNYSLTLLDSLSTLAILAGDPHPESNIGPQALDDFQHGVSEFVRLYGDGRKGPSGTGSRATGFDLDSKVQVFETVIRGLGGLLSAHLFAVGELPITGYDATPVKETTSDDPLEAAPIQWPNGFLYDGQLLRLALDLGERILPAFYTSTGIPYPRVNLRHGIPFYTKSPLHGDEPDADDSNDHGRPEITETCSAGAGSLTLEFSVLSRLTGDDRFEQAAKRAFFEVWDRRSSLGLIGNGLDAERGVWIGPHSGIGAGMDSFFEYAVKSYILLSGNDVQNVSKPIAKGQSDRLDPNSLHPPLHPDRTSPEAFLETWHQAHSSVKKHIYNDRLAYPYYANNKFGTGEQYTTWIDSLGAFYAGLLVLAGETDEAVEANLLYTALWTRYSGIPERWSFRDLDVEGGLGWWPGRPEFIESTYYIYRATKDPWYLYVGEMVLRDIKARCYAPCGWAGLQDVRTGQKADRMESFFLGETTKYLYLLFEPEHALNKLDAPYVFSTEGHPLIIPKERHPRPRKAANSSDGKKALAYYDESYTNSCPVPVVPESLTGSATAARRDLFHVSRFTGLYNTPNPRGPHETVRVYDKKKGQVIKYRPTSNHTLFPWTLPPQLLPPDGQCAVPVPPRTQIIEFPATDTIGSILGKYGTNIEKLEWGPLVKNVAGLQMVVDHTPKSDVEETSCRITRIGPTEVGPNELVFFHAEDIKVFRDEAFSATRRQDKVRIGVIDSPKSENGSKIDDDYLVEDRYTHPETVLKSLFRTLTSVFDSLPTGVSASRNFQVRVWDAYTGVGPGAFPMPEVNGFQNPLVSKLLDMPDLPWKTIFVTGQACNEPLPEAAPRHHQVIVMRRGGCNFARKLNNIPSFPQTPDALQLVLIVDDSGSKEPVRPLIETEQVTPSGMKRLHGIPMALMTVYPGELELLKEAKAVGMSRIYDLTSHGSRITNAIVL